MQIDLADVMATAAAVVVLILAVFCIAAIWAAALGTPAFHIPWVETHA